MSAMLTADWFPLGRDVYFRKFELYPISFQYEISSNNLLVAAPYGGSIAVTRNPKKLVKVQGANKPLILLYTASGKPTAKLQWSSGQLISFGWSQQEELLCVQDDGMVLIYDMFGTYQHTFSMGNAAKDTKVIDAKFFATSNSTGIAVLTSTNRIFLVNNVSEPKVRPITDMPRYPIDCWYMVHCDRETQVILSNREGIFVIHQSHPNTYSFSNLFGNKINNVIAIAVSTNNRHIALYSDTGHLYIGSIDFREKYCECYTNMKEPLANIAWCGTEAVVCSWNSTIMVVGRTADTIVYNYDGPVHLVTEIDGVRVLSSSSHEMIQKVPNVVQRIFRINSTDPASYLLEASKQFQKKSHKADSYIDLVKDKLDSAIKACIDGASHEFDFETQKILMRAAKFGKGFSKTIDSEYYVQMCRILRVLNAVRHPAVGIPLTYTQFNILTNQVLLDRLVARRHYYLSIQVARHLQLPEIDGESRILAHWACYKVKQTQLDKEQIAEEIADKLGYAPGVSYSEIAKRAADCGRKQLATDIKIFQSFFQLHGKTFDYKIPMSTVLRLFLLPHKDNRQMFFVVSLDPPIKQGQTRYHYLVLLFNQEEETSIELPFTEKELKDKYEDKLTKELSGPTYEVLGKVMKVIINRKLTGPGHFTGHTGTPAISCSFKAAAGYIYPLERGFMYVHKPPIHIRFEEIASVNFARGGGSTRSFDFEIELTSGVVHTFSSIEKEEYGKLFDFITVKKLRVKNRGKSDKVNYDEDFGDSDQEDEPDAYLARVKAEAQERDGEENQDSEEGSTDEDFNPNQDESDVAEEYDSNPNSSESEDSDASAASHKKEKKEKKEKKSKSAKTVSEKPRKQRKPKKERDANKPKRPPTAFMLWLNSARDGIKADNPGIVVTEIAKKGGEMWRELKDKSEWEAKAAKAKKEYAASMKEYEASGGGKTKDKDKEKKTEKKKEEKKETKKESPSKLMSGTSFKSKEYISDDDSSSDESKKSEKKRSDNESEDEKDKKKKPEKRPAEDAGKKTTKKGKRDQSDESDAEEPIESTPSSSDAESKNSD